MVAKFIHYGGQIIYAIYILKIFYSVNNTSIYIYTLGSMIIMIHTLIMIHILAMILT